MAITSNSRAPANAIGGSNEVLANTTRLIPRKACIIGIPQTEKTADNSIISNVAQRFFSAKAVGALAGFGSAPHLMADAFMKGCRGAAELWCIFQEEDAAVAATYSVTFVAPSVSQGTLFAYDAGRPLAPIAITAGETAVAIAAAYAAVIQADPNSSVTAAVGTAGNTHIVTVTAKSKGVWGNGCKPSFAEEANTALPTGLTITVSTDPVIAGSGDPTYADVLTELGTGYATNRYGFTDIIPSNQLSATMATFSVYNGEGNLAVGGYDSLVHRPFNAFYGHTGTTLSTLTDVTDAKKFDRTSCWMWLPGSPNNPQVIAAAVAGESTGIAATRAEGSAYGSYMGYLLPGSASEVGSTTGDYDVRNAAIAAGISTCDIKSGVLQIQALVTFYRPDDVPVENNAYKSVRNCHILQNVFQDLYSTWEQPTYKSMSLVADASKVTSSVSGPKVLSVLMIKAVLKDRIEGWEKLAWIYSAAKSVEALKAADAVVLRSGGDGFNYKIKIVFSGEQLISNGLVIFDSSLAWYTN